MSTATNNSELWDAQFARVGHTGYSDPIIYRYDQPLRIKAVEKVLRGLYPQGLGRTAALDIGCGSGDFIQLLVDLGAAQVHGMDISSQVVKATSQRFKHAASVSLEAGRIQDAALPDGGLDLVTSITVLQHLLDDEEAIAVLLKLAKALQPSGVIIALEISPSGKVRPSAPDMIRERTLDQWRDLFSRSGLSLAGAPLVYSPLGFCLVQLWLPALLNRLTGGRWRNLAGTGQEANSEAAGQTSTEMSKPSLPRRAYSLVRAMMLKAAYPVDHLVQFRVPSRLAYYHTFVLRKAAQV